jgi:hypothetical protein
MSRKAEKVFTIGISADAHISANSASNTNRVSFVVCVVRIHQSSLSVSFSPRCPSGCRFFLIECARFKSHPPSRRISTRISAGFLTNKLSFSVEEPLRAWQIRHSGIPSIIISTCIPFCYSHARLDSQPPHVMNPRSFLRACFRCSALLPCKLYRP